MSVPTTGWPRTLAHAIISGLASTAFAVSMFASSTAAAAADFTRGEPDRGTAAFYIPALLAHCLNEAAHLDSPLPGIDPIEVRACMKL